MTPFHTRGDGHFMPVAPNWLLLFRGRLVEMSDGRVATVLLRRDNARRREASILAKSGRSRPGAHTAIAAQEEMLR
jgi:hypothetical protein